MKNMSLVESDWCLLPYADYTLPMEQEENYIKPNGTITGLPKPPRSPCGTSLESSVVKGQDPSSNSLLNKWNDLDQHHSQLL